LRAVAAFAASLGIVRPRALVIMSAQLNDGDALAGIVTAPGAVSVAAGAVLGLVGAGLVTGGEVLGLLAGGATGSAAKAAHAISVAAPTARINFIVFLLMNCFAPPAQRVRPAMVSVNL